jgi:hypothetical protein
MHRPETIASDINVCLHGGTAPVGAGCSVRVNVGTGARGVQMAPAMFEIHAMDEAVARSPLTAWMVHINGARLVSSRPGG